MYFDLTDEQEAIRSTARDFLASRFKSERMREIAGSADGTDAQGWQEMSELGWAGLALPEDYKAFLRLHDGARGWIGNTRFELWRAADLAAINRDQAALGLLAFGGDGQQALLAFDLRSERYAVAIVPVAAFNTEAARTVAKSFSGLLYRLAQTEGSLFGRQSDT